METAFSRNYNNKCKWFQLDFPNVLSLRETYIPKQEGEYYLPYSMFDYKWIDEVKKESKEPVLFIGSGILYYYSEKQVVELIQNLKRFDDAQLVFDVVSSTGLKIAKKYMRQFGKKEAELEFFVNNSKDFVKKISPETKLIEELCYYRDIKKQNFQLSTKVQMCCSDKFGFVKMAHLKL